MGILKSINDFLLGSKKPTVKSRPKSREELIREALKVRAENKDVVLANISEEERERFLREAMSVQNKMKKK